MDEVKSYLKENEENIKRDLKRLVDVRSVKGEPEEGAPYGAGVRRAELAAIDMMNGMGLETRDCEGRIAFGHYGDKERFIGVIAHVDVVPEGNGWESDPFCCAERDGYLVGRGTLDDKGPFVAAAYAVKYLIEKKVPLKYGIRLIAGLDEETGMTDVEYYKSNFKLPVFTFTPDSDFPVGHGEKGYFEADLVSPKLGGGNVVELSGGVASNVVADYAYALLKGVDADKAAKAAENQKEITVLREANGVKVEARGVAAHAGSPDGSLNANLLLMRFLLDAGLLTEAEAKAAEFMCLVMSGYDGAQLGLDMCDGIFTPQTIIGGMTALRDGRFVLNVNSRFPTNITGKEVEERLQKKCADFGFSCETVSFSEPFWLDPEKVPAVGMMCDIYNEVTGEDKKPYVMSGGTYARHLDNAVSYGIEFPDDKNPAWVGNVHMKNEAVKISRLLDSCEIFIRTLIKLQEVDF